MLSLPGAVASASKAAAKAPKMGDFIGNTKLAYCIHSFTQARSSVGERFLDTEEVGSSILPVPTIF